MTQLESLLSPLQLYRKRYQPKIPAVLKDLSFIKIVADNATSVSFLDPGIAPLFPLTGSKNVLEFIKTTQQSYVPVRIGVVLSGGQAPGGHNVIAGLFDALIELNPNTVLFGFLNGPIGMIDNQTILITPEIISRYRNQGGFDMIGSGRTKIETPEQFQSVLRTVQSLNLDGVVVIGGDDSNTNAAFLSEYLKQNGSKTGVIGVPKTIDGDLKNEFVEVSFGFDTACKVYSEFIGNILIDMISSKKHYFFIKLMGRSASHITLECALKTHPNLVFISEEVAEKKISLAGVVNEIVVLICKRAEVGKQFGAILIPEGLIEFIPEFKEMISEINQLLIVFKNSLEDVKEHLSSNSRACFDLLPQTVQNQLFLDRDPHGNVQVSKIETERLLAFLVEQQLDCLKKKGEFCGKFNYQSLFCGYEGRSALPSNFDAQYCYSLGRMAALMLSQNKTGYLCCLKRLAGPVDQWQPLGIPFVSLLNFEMRGGERRAVIRKALVDLKGEPFNMLVDQREKWAYSDLYSSPGPIQFEGPDEIIESRPFLPRF
jgi:diphosphate-dependent phosphofructokinase